MQQKRRSRRGSRNPGYRDDYEEVNQADYRPPSRSIRVEGFDQHFQNLQRDGKFHFSEEFKLIRNGPNSQAEHSVHPVNRDKNRYTNIVAYDHTRVLLNRVDNTPEGDYINANYIDGYGREAAYIAAQGPLENTTEDFWRMVWEQDVPVIVMLTRCEENGKRQVRPMFNKLPYPCDDWKLFCELASTR